MSADTLRLSEDLLVIARRMRARRMKGAKVLSDAAFALRELSRNLEAVDTHNITLRRALYRERREHKAELASVPAPTAEGTATPSPQLEAAKADSERFWLDLASEMNREWHSSVLHRPDVNIYKAGMDKTLKMLEARFLERHNARAARAQQGE